jgi:hypothetical protein
MNLFLIILFTSKEIVGTKQKLLQIQKLLFHLKEENSLTYIWHKILIFS